MHEKTQQEEGAAAPIFAELRAAASALVKAHPEVVRVDEAAIERLAAGARPALTAQEVKAKAERVALPHGCGWRAAFPQLWSCLDRVASWLHTGQVGCPI